MSEDPPTPPSSLSISNWAHSSAVSYVFHRKYKHKQDCGICREGRESIAAVFH